MEKYQKIYEDLMSEVDSMGIDIFGVASAQQYAEQFSDLPSPELFIPNAKTIILIGEIIEPSTMRTLLHPELANSSKLHSQNASVGSLRDINPQKYFMIEETEVIKVELTRIGRHITRKLRKLGFNAMNMPLCKRDSITHKAPFVHAPAIYLAGLGTKGLNGTMITPEFGPRFYVNSIITDCPLPTGKPLEKELCTECSLCMRACPLGAIRKDGTLDIAACTEYDTCSTCVTVCPVGDVRPFSPKEVNEWLNSEREIWTLEDRRQSKE